MPKPTLDIVVPVYNSSDLTWRCIQHLEQFGVAGQRIILVDDASNDTTGYFRTYLQERGHAYLKHPFNRGCHAAWNTGLASVEAPVVAFVNNDIAVMPDCLRRLLDAVNAGAEYAAANEIRGAWSPALYLNYRGSNTRRADYFNSCFMMPTQLVKDLGAFDDQFRWVYGDVDFLQRLWDRGGKTWIVENALAYHGGSMTRRREAGRDMDISKTVEDRQRFESKWAHRPDVLKRHPPETEEQMVAGRDNCWAELEKV
jgi:GT2 family glycosyltransferase